MITPLDQTRSSTGGFTLVELLVSMLVMSIVAGSAVGVAVAVGRSSVSMQQVQDDMAQARLGIDRIRREVRGATRVLDSPSGRTLRIWVDANNDGQAQADEVITYELSGTEDGAELVRYQGLASGTPQVVARNLLFNEPFGYFPAPPDTQLLDVVLLVDSRGLDDEFEAFRAEGQIRLRNVQN